MLPDDLRTVITPSATIHFAGELSAAETHSSRFLPSKRMTASDGGTVQLAPGVTTFGTGSQTSVSCGFGGAGVAACDDGSAPCACGAGGENDDWARRGTATAINAAHSMNFKNSFRVIRRKYTEWWRRGQANLSRTPRES